MPTDLEPVTDAPADLVPVDAPQAPFVPQGDVLSFDYGQVPHTNWPGVYRGGFGPEQQAALEKVAAGSANPEESKHHAINRAYLHSQMPSIGQDTMDANWQSVKDAYAKNALGLDVKGITDTRLHNEIAKGFGDEQGEIKPWTLADRMKSPVFQTSKATSDFFNSDFWQSVNKPLAELPDAPKDLPDIPAMGLGNPALAGAVWNGLKPAIEGVESPLGIATLGSTVLEHQGLRLLAETYPQARVALAGMTGIFTGLMAHSAIKGAPEHLAVINDPKASFQDKIEAGTKLAADAGMTLLGAVGTAIESLPLMRQKALVEALPGKNPAEAAQVLREEAKQDLFYHQEELTGSGREKISTTLADLVGTEVRYSGYSGKLIRDAEGNFVVLREISQKGQSNQVEVEGTGKDPTQNADIIGVVPEAGWKSAARDIPLLEAAHALDKLSTTPERQMAKVNRELQGKIDKLPTAQTPDTTKPIGIKNETINAELKSMGLPEPTKEEALTFKGIVEQTAERVKQDPEAGSRLVAELKGSPRAPTADENVLLGFEANRRRVARNEAETAYNEAQKTGDQSAINRAELVRAASRDSFKEAADLADLAGTKSGQSLAFRKVMLREDYSYAGIERRFENANEGKPLKPEDQAKIKELSSKIAELEKAIASGERLPPRRPPPPNKVRAYLSEQAKAARERIKSRAAKGASRMGADPADAADAIIVGADYIAKGFDKFAEWSGEMLREFGEVIRPHLQAIFDHAKEARADAARLGAFKTRTAKAIEGEQTRLKTGDFSKEPRRPIPLDREAQQMRDDLQRLRRMTDLEERRIAAQAAPRMEKLRTGFQKIVRAGALSYPSVVLKLGSAAMGRFIVTPVEQLAGYGFTKLLPEAVTSKARFEAVPTFKGLLESEVKALAEGLTTGVKGSIDLLKNRDTDLSVRLAKELHDHGILDYIGKIHEAIKNPAKVADFNRRFTLAMAADAKMGIDVTHPVEQLRIAHESYEYAQRSVFLQDNGMVNAYKAAIRSLEAKQKSTGQSSPALKLLSTVIQAELPIVKVPTNVVAEISEYVSGSLQGPARLAWEYAKGIKGLTYGEADTILRQFKKGAIGAGVLLLGYYQADKIGGFYQRGEKRKTGDVEAEKIRLGSADVPKQLLDSPLFDVLQYGATVNRVSGQLIKKAGGNPKGPLRGLFAASVGLVDEVPFIRGMEFSKFSDWNSFLNAADAKAASILIPGAFAWTAAQLDKKHPFHLLESPTSRKADNLGQALEKNIPGLRQHVPAKDRDPWTSYRNQ